MKTVKRLFASFLVVLIVLTSAPLSGFVGLELPDFSNWFSVKAEAASCSGTCGDKGDNLTWTLDTESGVLKISDTGAMKDYKYNGDKAPWYSNCRFIKTISIGDGVTTIGDYAFSHCVHFTSVTIPDSVTTIGRDAFQCCEALTSITIPDSVTTIGDSAFFLCYALKSVTIPDSVTTIGNYVFYSCEALTSVTIPDSVTTIGDSTFRDCDKQK